MTAEGDQSFPRNVLVVAPTVGTVSDELCARLSSELHDAETVIGVTVLQSPASRRERWHTHADFEGIETEFVTVEARTRAPADATAAASTETPVPVETVEDPTDLAALGRAIGRRLDAADGETTVCLHSLSALLEYVEREAALTFLHTLADRVTEADATAHYHLDSAAHDQEVLELFATVTDRVVELSPDGSDVSIA